MSVDMSDRFGMEMGVQRYYDAMSGRWETVPVMIPYYHFDKFTLGLDVVVLYMRFSAMPFLIKTEV